MQTGYIDYDKLEEKASDFRPQLIICGGSAYPREWDYKRLYEIAKKVGALLMSDMAHIRCGPDSAPGSALLPLLSLPSSSFANQISVTTVDWLLLKKLLSHLSIVTL